MAYQRKTRDEWQLFANYGYGYEVVLSEYTFKECKMQAKCYRENQPQYNYKIKKIRVPISNNR